MTQNFLRLSFSLILLISSALLLRAQDAISHSDHLSIGVQYSRGSQDLFNWKPHPYYYSLDLYELIIRYNWKKGDHWNLDLIAMPQYNRTKYRLNEFETENRSGHEYGLNLGLMAVYTMKRVSPYVCLSAGPHYVSGTPERQVPGFIFSDNLELGILIEISNKVQLSLNGGFRHISNASLKSPNGGVNSFIFGIGSHLKINRK